MGKSKKHKEQRPKNLAQPAYVADGGCGLLLVDCNNVRGAGLGFQHTLAEFLDLLAHWALAVGLSRRVFCIVDHGQTQDAYLYKGAIVVVFAGQGCTADDIICEDALGYSAAANSTHGQVTASARKVGVVTNDRNLKQRLKRAQASEQLRGRVKAFSSDEFKEMLVSALPREQMEQYRLGLLGELHSAEQRLREGQEMDKALGSGVCSSGDGESRNNGDSNSCTTTSSDTSGSGNSCDNGRALAEDAPHPASAYREVTWQRVLTAELCRRCLARAPKGSLNVEIAQPIASNVSIDCTDISLSMHLGLRKSSSSTSSSTKVSDRSGASEPAVDADSCGEGGALVGAEADAHLVSTYLQRRRLPLNSGRTLIWDHRIRHEPSMQAVLKRYVQKDFGCSQRSGDEEDTVGDESICAMAASLSLDESVPDVDVFEKWFENQLHL